MNTYLYTTSLLFKRSENIIEQQVEHRDLYTLCFVVHTSPLKFWNPKDQPCDND